MKDSAKVGAGLLAGAMLGIAAGLFLQSKKGKVLIKDASKKALALQKQVMKKLDGLEDLTKEKYEEVVEDVLAYYKKSKELAVKELPEAKKYLMSQWKKVEGALNEAKDA